MAGLTLSAIEKFYDKVPVINGIDLEIAHGEFVVFVGPSGCGKSTLLRMIAGLEDISSGELHIADKLCNEVAPRDRGIAMVFQSYALYPHMTVYENVGFGLKLARVPKQERDRKIRETAKILQMEHLLERRPAELSGGQRQRVAIGRAIVREPEVFLFDEPLSNLDAALRVEMRMEISKLHNELGATMIYVTHDQVEAMTLADKIVVLNDGIVQQVGVPMELYERPANLFVAGFIGSPKMNFISVTAGDWQNGKLSVSGEDMKAAQLQLSAAPAPGAKLTLGVRPQHLVLTADGPLSGTVQFVERLGDETIVNLRLDSGRPCLVSMEGTSAPVMDERLSFGVADGHGRLFGEAPTG